MSYQNKVQFQGVTPSNWYDFHSFHSETPITKTGSFRLAEFYVTWIFGWKITQTESSNGGVWRGWNPQSSRTHPRETKRRPWNETLPERSLGMGEEYWLPDLPGVGWSFKPSGLESKWMKKWLDCTKQFLNAQCVHFPHKGWMMQQNCMFDLRIGGAFIPPFTGCYWSSLRDFFHHQYLCRQVLKRVYSKTVSNHWFYRSKTLPGNLWNN